MLDETVPQEATQFNATSDLTTLLNNTDLTTIDRSMPLIRPGAYDVVFKKMEVRPAKTPGNHNLHIELSLVNGAETSDGKTVNPGYVLFDLVSLAKTEKYNPAERLADIQLATFGEQRKGFVPADYIGKQVSVTVKVEEENKEEGYPAKNRIARYRVKKAATSLSSL